MMTTRTSLFLSLLLSITGYAQEYSVQYSTSDYLPLVDAQLLDETNYFIDGSGSEVYEAIPIGFEFSYQGSTYDQIQVGGNGFVLFANGGIVESFINIFECPQVNFQDSALLSPIYYEVTGNPGEQIFKLEFVNSGFLNDEEGDDYINYQLWLYQSCSMFEIRFGDVSIGPTEFDLFYNNSPSAFSGYGANNPFFFYILAGNPATPYLQSNPGLTLISVPDSGSVYTFSNCSPNSLIEHEENAINIFPNPVSNSAAIMIENDMIGYELQIVNLNGKTVYTDVLKESETYRLNTDFLSQGIYVVNVISPNTIYSSKLVKK